MRLMFSTSKSVFGVAVRMMTRSRFSHVDFMLDDSQLFGALPGGTVQYHSVAARMQMSPTIVVMTVPLSEAQEADLRNWLKTQNGKPYDWNAAVTAFSLNARDWRDEAQWNCSELVSAGFETVGKPLFDARVLSRIVPEDIYRLPFVKEVVKGQL